MIGNTVSHYTILEKLGAGGMGVVYKAEDTRLGRSVALKFLPDELSQNPLAVERFEREARAVSALNHPHICSIHDVGEHGGRRFIVMEYLEGSPLDELLAAGALPTDQVVELGLQLADALEAAHDKGLIHRDIKPANIMLTRRGQIKLLDFGLAKSTSIPGDEVAATRADLTEFGVVLGTVAYMSPEQVRGEQLDARTDLFSLGAVLYEMATGSRPFSGNTSGTISEAILNRTPPPASRVNPKVPSSLEGIINKSLEKQRELRYQKAADVRADLQRLKRDTDSFRGASSVAAIPREAKQWWRRSGTLIVGTLAVVALALAGTWFVRPSTDAIGSVAVLPFVNGTGDPNTEYLSDGITESVIDNLSQLRSLRVTARSTVFRYKGKAGDPQKLGQDLRVGAVLSGRLLKQGDVFVIRAELMNVSDGSQLWGSQYHRKASDLFVLQEDVSRDISEKLRLRLTTEERQRLIKRYTENSEAYQLYLKGRYHWNKLSPDGLLKAVDYMQQALDKDPSYALAYAGMADAYNMISFFSVLPPREAMPKAKAAASKALEIDDGLAEAHLSLLWASFTYDWDWPAATRHLEQAMALNAAAVNEVAAYPFYLTIAGRQDEAISVARRASELDPVSAARSHTLSVQLLLARHFDEAISECRRTIELDRDFSVAYEVLAGALAAKGLYRDALPFAEKAVELSPHNAMSRAYLGYIYGRLGNRARALGIVDELTTASKERFIPALSFAVVFTGLGQKDQAFAWLDKAYEQRFNRLAYLKREPVWDSLRSDSRFDDILRRIGLPE
jgi:serine/threonine protein kinase/Tfp pilus assembly protein PilF